MLRENVFFFCIYTPMLLLFLFLTITQVLLLSSHMVYLLYRIEVERKSCLKPEQNPQLRFTVYLIYTTNIFLREERKKERLYILREG